MPPQRSTGGAPSQAPPAMSPPLPTAGNLRSASRNAPLRAFPQRPTIQPPRNAYCGETSVLQLLCRRENSDRYGRIRAIETGFCDGKTVVICFPNVCC